MTIDVRIDRFLHCIRVVKSRTIAQGVVEAGHVRIDGKRVEKIERGGASRERDRASPS
jgi:ribosomal 50S subunit-recycling heat shock protein